VATTSGSPCSLTPEQASTKQKPKAANPGILSTFSIISPTVFIGTFLSGFTRPSGVLLEAKPGLKRNFLQPRTFIEIVLFIRNNTFKKEGITDFFCRKRYLFLF